VIGWIGVAKIAQTLHPVSMQFRTKFVASVILLACAAIACAGLLIQSAQRNEDNQLRISLAFESLSGYLQIKGSVFRTFKQARRDIVSGDGSFAFDMASARTEIFAILDSLERASEAEEAALATAQTYVGKQNVVDLRAALMQAFNEIEIAAQLTRTGASQAGRSAAIETLETRVDLGIAALIEAGEVQERDQLQAAQAEIARFNRISKAIALASVVIALLSSALVLGVLLRRFNSGLKTLQAGAEEYAQNNLAHVIRIPGHDELTDVADRFSEMARSIQSKQAALAEIQQELEERVRDRTEALSAANQSLETRDRQRRQFFADIGHELRTPVTAIRGEAEVALRLGQDANSEHANALERIVTLSGQLTDYVTDLFLIAREQAGVLDFRDQQIDLNEAVALGVDHMGVLVSKHGSSLRQDLTDSAQPMDGNSSRISQVVRILISNALAHNNARIEIEVVTRRVPDGMELMISDSGIGIPAVDRDSVFERYVKGDSAVPGSGLGLAIARSIVQAHGGRIWVCDTPLNGACFRAWFPSALREAAE